LLLTHAYSLLSTATATTEIYTLSLHDALPIYRRLTARLDQQGQPGFEAPGQRGDHHVGPIARQVVQRGAQAALLQLRYDVFLIRSEEHTSELQSRENLVCRLLLEKKKKKRRRE